MPTPVRAVPMDERDDPPAGRRFLGVGRGAGRGGAGAIERAPRGRETPTATGKTPEATGGFWLAQALIAGTGACAAAALSQALGHPGAVAATACLLGAALTVQFRAHGYRVWAYWAAVAATGVAGAVAGGTGRGEPQNLAAWAAVGPAVVLAAAAGSRRLQGSVPTAARHGPRRRETLYWAAALTAFATATAAARLTAAALPMGRALAQVLFAAVVLGCSAAPWLAGAKWAAWAWVACLTVRPLGVAFAQWLAAPLDRGGLGWGQGAVSVLLGIIAAGQLGRFADGETTTVRPSGAANRERDPRGSPRAAERSQ
ncbi:hypothetical protein [Streptomyces sp. NPDC020917]|uniref:hypothetical protein n=1 Tax=Streptomyces sp. NPDC020917 TaxID=3365102 RepID=UPI0037A36872